MFFFIKLESIFRAKSSSKASKMYSRKRGILTPFTRKLLSINKKECGQFNDEWSAHTNSLILAAIVLNYTYTWTARAAYTNLLTFAKICETRVFYACAAPIARSRVACGKNVECVCIYLMPAAKKHKQPRSTATSSDVRLPWSPRCREKFARTELSRSSGVLGI